jgi:hypothetical protein
MGRIIFAAVAMVLGVAGLASAAGQEAKVADLSTPKGAVKAYFNAIKAGDASAAMAATVGDEESRSLADAAAAENRAKARLLAAASKQWGAAEASSKIGSAGEILIRMLDNAPVKVEGDRAVIGKRGDFVCRRVDGQWRFDLSASPRDEAIAASITRCRKAAEVNQRLAQEIEAGRWNSLDDVLQERDAQIPPPPPPPLPPGFPATRPAGH